MTRMRAQSETVGFVLVFSLIVASTGVVYVAGFSSLDDARTAEDLNNMERAFDVLAHNVRDLSRQGVPSRSTEIRLGDGSLELGEATNITVEVTYASNGTTIDNRSIKPKPIVYRIDDTEIVYTSGSIIRSERGGAVMRLEPRWIVDDDQTVIPLQNTSAQGDRTAVGGETTVQVETERGISGAKSYAPGPARANVSVTVESPRADAWVPFFEEQGFEAVDSVPADGDVTYAWNGTGEVHVQSTRVGVGFSL